jgi:type 2 lantibiotic biosynthesis protein LanM
MARPLDFLTDTSLEEKTHLNTDCPVWPYLAYYVHTVEKNFLTLDELATDEKIVIINGFLSNLSSRATAASNNVLFAEREIYEKTFNGKKVSAKEHFKIIRENPKYLFDILSAYPELDRVLEQLAKNFVEQSLRFATNLINDRHILSKITNAPENKSIVSCDVSEGETHNGSLTVCTLTFCNNERVVYKPRNLELESSASKILRSLADEAGNDFIGWEIPSYIMGPNHGWAQYMAHMPATSKKEVSQYYKRSGFLIGFCTAFTAADITSDNLIAHGTSPIPIDLETIFYSVLNTNNIPKEIRWNATQTSILPNWTWKGTDGIGVDLSALGGLKEQYVSLNLYQHLEDKEGNDGFGMDGVKIQPGQNVLYYNDEPAKPWQYEKEIIKGFECFFRVVKKNQPSVIETIKKLSGLACRYVPRSTATYHYAIQCSLHASLMTSTQARNTFLRKIFDNDTAPAIGFLDSEIRSCLDLDIPYARSKVGRIDFIEPRYNGQGHLDKSDYIDGLTHSLQYIENLTANRISFEKNLISNTLLAMNQMYEYDKKLTEHKFREHDSIEDIEQHSLDSILQGIERSQHINTDFIREFLDTELTTNGLWLGFHASPGGHIEYSELGEDFYYGITGILYGCVAASQWVSMPKNLVTSLMDRAYTRVYAKLTNKGTHLGGFHFGLSSAILPLYISLTFFDDARADSVLSAYKEYIKSIFSEDWWQKYFWGNDLLSGTLGTLTVITKLYELTDDEEFALLARTLYSKIEPEFTSLNGRKVVKSDKSITTHSHGLLSGISHGVMGCAYAIFYFNETIAQSESVQTIFLDFLAWELSDFDEKIQNWKDYRRRSDNAQGEFSWSHGLPGNYLALDYFASKNINEAIAFLEKHPANRIFSYEKLLQRKRPVNDSLCHGAYGLLNIIKKISPNTLFDHRIYIWANLPNLIDQDARPLRVRSADPLGLWVGKVGSILGSIGILNEKYEFPFLAHEMQFIQK